MGKFKDKNYYLYDFLDEVLVHCPKCKSKAKVINDRSNNNIELFCGQCGYYEKNDKIYYRLNFERNCPECGKRISLKIDKVANKKESMKIPCKHCGFTESYKPKYIEYEIVADDISNGEEPFFNVDLWLCKEYKGNLFWATNYKHLEYLKQYIEAKIRVRGYFYIDFRYNMTMAAKLPQFIKSGKNRDNLLKIIKQLENK